MPNAVDPDWSALADAIESSRRVLDAELATVDQAVVDLHAGIQALAGCSGSGDLGHALDAVHTGADELVRGGGTRISVLESGAVDVATTARLDGKDGNGGGKTRSSIPVHGAGASGSPTVFEIDLDGRLAARMVVGDRCDRVKHEAVQSYCKVAETFLEVRLLHDRHRRQSVILAGLTELQHSSPMDCPSASVEARRVTAMEAVRLTPRERDVLDLLVTGMSNRAIAERLVVSPETVRSHVKRVFRKFEVTNRVELIAGLDRGRRHRDE